jgi:signal transduction histidine kinase
MRRLPVSVPYRLAALCALLLGAGLTLILWWSAQNQAHQEAQQRFEFQVRETQLAIRQRLLAYEHVLRGAAGLFAASRQVGRDEWRRYIESLHLQSSYPGILGLGFSQWLQPGEGQALIQKMRAEGLSNFDIWPQSEHDAHSSIVFLEPANWRNQRALGFDMYSEATRRDAMERARDLATPIASGRVRLVQETESAPQHGFLMYLPVYPDGLVPADLQARRQALQGFVYSPFRMDDLMQGIFGAQAKPMVRLQIFDDASVDPERLMYDSFAGAAATDTSHFKRLRHVNFNGRQWTLCFASLPGFEHSIERQKPAMILGGGLLTSLLLAILVLLLGANRTRSQQLARANQGLQEEITERRKLADALVQSRDKAEAANQAKSEFLSNVSHELRTPLTLILAPVEELLDAAEPATRRPLARIKRNALILLNRVNDLLDFAKAEAGMNELHPRHVDLHQLISQLADDAAQLATNKNCLLHWQIDPKLTWGCLDPDHLEKILLNLLSNAIKFTPPGGRIELTAFIHDEQQFSISVSDSGPGISQEQLPLLFQRFQQLDNSTTREHGGTGLGLALTKELVELMGGTIEVHSEVGNGCCFLVQLPRGRQEPVEDSPPLPPSDSTSALLRRSRLQESADSPQAPASALAAAAAPTTTARVLVADDNSDLLQYIGELLAAECTVVLAADGLQAWSLLQSQPFDLLLSDVMMPGLDGLSLASRVKADPRLAQLPVLLLTARGSQDDSISGLASGANDYIAKPFSPAELRARVRGCLRLSQAQHRLQARAHDAGMALQAAGILHNLGNVLSGVTVSSARLRDKLQHSKISSVRRLAELLQAEPSAPHGGASEDESRSPQVPAYALQLAEHLEAEQRVMLADADRLRSCVEHVEAVLASQRQLIRPDLQVREPVAVAELLNHALQMAQTAFIAPDLRIERFYAKADIALTDRHQVLQILLNLLRNANQAMAGLPAASRCISVHTFRGPDCVRLEIQDNGVGIAAERMASLFDQGTTTQGEGHGYGLHMSAYLAQGLGGRISCRSDGPGLGACFSLELPAPCSPLSTIPPSTIAGTTEA